MGLEERLSGFPTFPLAYTPTPLELLRNLSRRLGGPDVWIKREDCSGFAGGGNKARCLEFILADAIARRATTLITAGGVQSNHSRQTAAAGAKSGLRVVIVALDIVSGRGAAYYHSGNAFLDELFGAEVRVVGALTDPAIEMRRIANEVRSRGERPYIVPIGGANGRGVLGHVRTGFELRTQAKSMKRPRLVLASGSGATQAGLAIARLECEFDIDGYSIGLPREAQLKRVRAAVQAGMDVLKMEEGAILDELRVDETQRGGGYGQPTEEGLEAIRLLARTEGILLDPVYTGKAFAGLIAAIRKGELRRGENVIMIHTGGSAALFAYRDEIAAHDSSRVVEAM